MKSEIVCLYIYYICYKHVCWYTNWKAFEGASNMSRKKNGVLTFARRNGLLNGCYVHCTSDLLHLAAANVANGFKPLHALLLTCTGDTWWTLHYQAVKAIRLNLPAPALVLTLQNIHCCAGDLPPEADGLLHTGVEMLNPTELSHRLGNV